MALNSKLRILVGRPSDIAPHLPHQFPEDVRIRHTEKDQNASGYGSANDTSDSTEGAEPGADGRGCCCHHDGGDYNDAIFVTNLPIEGLLGTGNRRGRSRKEAGALRGMAQREEGPHCHRFLAGGD